MSGIAYNHFRMSLALVCLGIGADYVSNVYKSTLNDYKPRWKMLQKVLTFVWRFLPAALVASGTITAGVVFLFDFTKRSMGHTICVVVMTILVTMLAVFSLVNWVCSTHRHSHAEISTV